MHDALKSVKTTQEDKSFIKKKTFVEFDFIIYIVTVFRLHTQSVTTFKSLTYYIRTLRLQIRVKVSARALFHIDGAGLKMPQILICILFGVAWDIPINECHA